jgi:Altronate dehydratase
MNFETFCVKLRLLHAKKDAHSNPSHVCCRCSLVELVRAHVSSSLTTLQNTVGFNDVAEVLCIISGAHLKYFLTSRGNLFTSVVPTVNCTLFSLLT